MKGIRIAKHLKFLIPEDNNMRELVYQNKNYRVYATKTKHYVLDHTNSYVWEAETLWKCIEWIDLVS